MNLVLLSLATVAVIVFISGGVSFFYKKHENIKDLVSSVPGDNSLYIKGVSRYVWIPDGKNVPHLVDLNDPSLIYDSGKTAINKQGIGDENQYWLYTRMNAETSQIITIRNEESLNKSNFDRNKPLYVIVHGWMSSGHTELNPLITSAILSVEDANVIVLDWSDGAGSLYTIGVIAVRYVGEALGDFLMWVVDTTGASWEKIHLIGFSLGGHVVGNAGRRTKSLLARITGLDPAGPLWDGNENALKSTDAKYVEVIHTNGGTLGIFEPIGHADFYPNGGCFQPNCILTCSHTRATELFASSVRFNHFDGKQCSSIEAINDQSCEGKVIKMGNADCKKRGDGLYGLSTTGEWPF